MAVCVDSFSITVVGSVLNCEMMIDDSNFDPPSYTASELVAARTVNVPFFYKIGAPARTAFDSQIVGDRSGAAGTAPTLGAQNFTPGAPNQAAAAGERQSAVFSIDTPVYDATAAVALGTGIDNYSINIYIREANDVIADDVYT